MAPACRRMNGPRALISALRYGRLQLRADAQIGGHGSPFAAPTFGVRFFGYHSPSAGVQTVEAITEAPGSGLPLDDCDELLRRCQHGDQRALTDLVRGFQERIYRLAFGVTNDAALAEEAAAQALLKVWNKAGQWSGQSRASTWIYRLALRTVLDVQRGQRRWWKRWSAPGLSLLRDRRPGPAEQVQRQDERDEQSRRLHAALQQLTDSDRALVHLYYFESKGLAELETILGTPRENLKMRLARARQRLRSLLKDPDEAD